MPLKRKTKNPHKNGTMDYYKKNPKAYEKKRAKTQEVKRKYNERRRFKRKHGLEGNMGNRDVSHTSSGKLVLEKRGSNRRRNGEGGRRVKK